MTKYVKLTVAPEVQAKTTSSQAPPTKHNDHPSGKNVIINPQSEHKLGLVNKEFTKLGPRNVSCVYRRTGTIVRFASDSDLEKYKTLLAAHKVDYRDDKRTSKYVLKGLSPAFHPKDIQSELVEGGFEVIEVTNMVSWVTKRPLPMFRLTLESGANSTRIEDVKQVGLHIVKIEPFHRNRKPPKCSNCQGPKHTAGRCKAPPRCRKCSEEHKTHECPTRSVNNGTRQNPPTQSRTQTTKAEEKLKVKSKHISTQTPPPKETIKQKPKLKSTGTQTTPTKLDNIKPKTTTQETQTRPPKVKTEKIKSRTITTQTDPPVINIPEIQELPFMDTDIEEPTPANEKTKRKAKTKTKKPPADLTKIDDRLAQIAAQLSKMK
jgi:Predicted DNA-binding protein containing a Zn-ribbon domain